MTDILSLSPLAGSLEDCAWLACRSALNACFFWQGNKYVYSHSGYGQERLSQLSSSMTFRVVDDLDVPPASGLAVLPEQLPAVLLLELHLEDFDHALHSQQVCRV